MKSDKQSESDKFKNPSVRLFLTKPSFPLSPSGLKVIHSIRSFNLISYSMILAFNKKGYLMFFDSIITKSMAMCKTI